MHYKTHSRGAREPPADDWHICLPHPHAELHPTTIHSTQFMVDVYKVGIEMKLTDLFQYARTICMLQCRNHNVWIDLMFTVTSSLYKPILLVLHLNWDRNATETLAVSARFTCCAWPFKMEERRQCSYGGKCIMWIGPCREVSPSNGLVCLRIEFYLQQSASTDSWSSLRWWQVEDNQLQTFMPKHTSLPGIFGCCKKMVIGERQPQDY